MRAAARHQPSCATRSVLLPSMREGGSAAHSRVLRTHRAAWRRRADRMTPAPCIGVLRGRRDGASGRLRFPAPALTTPACVCCAAARHDAAQGQQGRVCEAQSIDRDTQDRCGCRRSAPGARRCPPPLPLPCACAAQARTCMHTCAQQQYGLRVCMLPR